MLEGLPSESNTLRERESLAYSAPDGAENSCILGGRSNGLVLFQVGTNPAWQPGMPGAAGQKLD